MNKTIVHNAAIAFGVAATLFIAWQAAATLLLIFAGILLAVLLHSLARALSAVVPIGHAGSLILVCLGLTAGLAAAMFWSGYNLSQEWGDLTRTLNEQVRAINRELGNLGYGRAPDGSAPKEESSFPYFLAPAPDKLFGQAQNAFTTVLGVVGNAVLVGLIGIFGAAQPQLYRTGLLGLVPRNSRARAAAIIDEIVETLRWWLVGQLVTMIIVGTSVWFVLALIGVPGALLLGILSGLFNFIPYLGPIIAAVPIGLAAVSQGASALIWALCAYAGIQMLEGYVLLPIIHKRSINMPPLLTLASLMIFGALFGAAGVAVACPFVAAARVIVLQLFADFGDVPEQYAPPEKEKRKVKAALGR